MAKESFPPSESGGGRAALLPSLKVRRDKPDASRGWLASGNLSVQPEIGR